ncbi:hypothetical protein [Streptomyces sp. CB03911]|uniref:hypothetical protein n=1 Tax=Streptomycetaceae TaxID=2062 RepID=UPI0018FE56FF|nr:hypothetical protein [Streptomyces sp. CB03911]
MRQAKWIPRLSTRARLVVGAVLCVAVAELVLQTWWLPSKWNAFDAAADGQALVSADGRTITLTVNWQCEQEPELVAREGADHVDVLLHRRAFKGPTYQCPENAVGSALISTHLGTPLAARPLVDAVAGHPIAYFDGRDLAKPSYLPPDYSAPTQDPAPYPDSAAPHAKGPSWTTGYRPHQGGPGLVITQTRLATPTPETSSPQAMVNGHPATFSDSPTSKDHSIIWSDGTYTFTVSSRPASLPDEELLRVAEGLKRS